MRVGLKVWLVNGLEIYHSGVGAGVDYNLFVLSLGPVYCVVCIMTKKIR